MRKTRIRRGLFHCDAIPIPDSFAAILEFDDIAPAAVAGAVAGAMAARARMIDRHSQGRKNSRHSADRARQGMIARYSR